MPLTSNPRLTFAKRCSAGYPVPGEHLVLDTSKTIDLDNVPLDGGYLTKTLVLSPEPYLLERMHELGPEVTSYIAHYILGAPVMGFAVMVVIRSEKEGIKVGDYVYGHTCWEAYTVQPYVEGRIEFKSEDWSRDTFDVDALFPPRLVPDPKGAYPLARYCGVLGTAGLSAFTGFEGLANAKEGQTIFVSSGASAVGSCVVQLAKLKGLKVIASAGQDFKVEYMKKIGADHVFNYRTEGYREPLKKYGPVDIYWDNVGGLALEEALHAMAPYGLVLMCGGSSEYVIPFDQRHGIRNTAHIFRQRLTVKGWLVPDLPEEFVDRFLREIPALVAQGKVVGEEHVIEGWENVAQALVDTLKGNFDGIGKPVVVVAEN